MAAGGEGVKETATVLAMIAYDPRIVALRSTTMQVPLSCRDTPSDAGDRRRAQGADTEEVTVARIVAIVLMGLLGVVTQASAQATNQGTAGLRGDPAAIADAEAMVESMGGLSIWRELESLHFVHEWDIFSRPDTYLENEILDLTGPRSYVAMKSEIYSRVRAYSPERGYWSIVNDEFSYASDEALKNAMERAPYSIYRLARAIARGDSYYDVRFGPMKDIPDVQALEFRGPDDEIHGWILLNVRKEPVVWATTQYSYSFGPLERFGSVRVPNWAMTGGGRVRYRMVSLTGSNEPPDPELFLPPPGFREER
jgi:hypothetical protein